MDMDDIEIIEPETPIQKFYSNSTVFITGGTGFLGRLLIEKLLRSCPDIVKVYVLVRNKNGKDGKERIEELLKEPLFNIIKEKNENITNKVAAIVGDCTLPRLGLNAADEDLLIQNVNVVFHIAGMSRFAEKLKTAAVINVAGTHAVLKLCRAMENLKSFLHFSTAYSHCSNDVISERFYPSPTQPRKLMNLVKNLNDSLMEELTTRFLGKYPNTYTFTKAVAEELVQNLGNDLPAAIIRPSFVISTYREPYPGYVNTFYGLTGVIATASCGLLGNLYCKSKETANIVPADMCVNAMIAISVDAARSFSVRPNECNLDVPIYHFESSRDQHINWGEYFNKVFQTVKKWPTMQAVWHSSFTLEKSHFANFVMIMFCHFLPGLFSDLLMFMTGRKPWLTKTCSSIFKMSTDLSYFTTRNFTFVSRRMHFLIDRMTPEDQNLFFCDLRKLHWDEYFENYFLGIRIHLLKDPLKTIRAARQKSKWLHLVSEFCKIIFFLNVLIFTFYVTRK